MARLENQAVLEHLIQVESVFEAPGRHQLDTVIGNEEVLRRRSRAAEEALQEKEQSRQLALAGAGVGIWTSNLQTGETFWDDRAQEIVGMTPDEVTTLEKGLSTIHPDDRQRALQAYEAAMQPEVGHFEIEYRVLRPDGTICWVATQGHVQFQEDGKQRRPVRIIGIVMDDTQQKEMEKALREREELLRIALMHAPITLWQQDEQLRYRWILNPQLGYREEEVVGKRDVELMESCEDAERIEGLKRQVFETGTGQRAEVAVSHGGRVHYYDLTIEPLLEASRVRHITCAAVDITHHREAEAERERMVAELVELNETLEERVRAFSRSLAQAEQRERRRIAQVLHDDVQQMLVALQIQLALLGRSVEPELQDELRKRENFVREIAEATRSLSMELATPALQSEKLGDSLRWLVDVMEARYQLRVEVQVEGPCTIRDRNLRELMFRTVRELLFNIVKHAGVKEASVLVADNGDEVNVVVVDKGAGFVVDDALRPNKQSASLGLFSVRERTRLFGGRFEIDSAPGVGTRITITMPKASS